MTAGTMIYLQEMTEADFTEFKPFMVEIYAQDIARNYRTPIEEAQTSSANQINGLLSQGLATPQHFLFNIILAEEKAEQRMGYLWLRFSFYEVLDDPDRLIEIAEWESSEARQIWLKRSMESGVLTPLKEILGAPFKATNVRQMD